MVCSEKDIISAISFRLLPWQNKRIIFISFSDKSFKVGTGISGMRESIESVGGKLKVLNDPKFNVVLTF